MLRWLVVEDDARLRRALHEALEARGAEVVACASVAEAHRALADGAFQGIIADVMLPDGNAVDVVERAMTCAVAPTIVAISGSASPAVSFRLAQMGVRSFLAKPLRLEELERTIDDALARPPDLRPQVRAAVGRASIQDVEEQVRTVMVDEALARAGGNRRKAAKLLNISRQLLQHILRRRS
ncbi:MULTISPECIES: response regulator [Sorangium]|nr:response regulator [Sorangium cellulosum]